MTDTGSPGERAVSTDKLAERIRTRLAEAFPELDAADPAFFDQAAHEAADEASAEIARRDRSIVELTRAGRGVLDQRNEALAEVERLTARIDAAHRTLSSVDIDEESCSTLESTMEAVVSSWHRIAESEAAAADRIDALTRELDTLHRLFDMQQERMREATELWRSEDPERRALTLPDLGDLLKWLMDRADRLREALETIGTTCLTHSRNSQTCSDVTSDRRHWCARCIAREALTAPATDEGSAR